MQTFNLHTKYIRTMMILYIYHLLSIIYHILILLHAALFGSPKRCRRLANKGWALSIENFLPSPSMAMSKTLPAGDPSMCKMAPKYYMQSQACLFDVIEHNSNIIFDG